MLHKIKVKSKTPRSLPVRGVLLFKENGIILTFNNYRGTSIVAFICQRYMHIYNAELFRQF